VASAGEPVPSQFSTPEMAAGEMFAAEVFAAETFH
jgi:hypothetical protein